MSNQDPRPDQTEDAERRRQVELERLWRQETTKVELPLPPPGEPGGSPDNR